MKMLKLSDELNKSAYAVFAQSWLQAIGKKAAFCGKLHPKRTLHGVLVPSVMMANTDPECCRTVMYHLPIMCLYIENIILFLKTLEVLVCK